MAIVADDLTTELDAVNMMLDAIGEDYVSSLDDSLADVAVARKTLARVSRHVQAKGWHFNREQDYPLIPDGVSKEIVLPADVIRIDASEVTSHDITLRGQRVYDRENRTYEFEEELEVDAVILLEFDDLPETARQYIAIKAIRQFVDKMVPSEALHTFTQIDEREAKALMLEYEGDTADFNIFDNAELAMTLVRNPY